MDLSNNWVRFRKKCHVSLSPCFRILEVFWKPGKVSLSFTEVQPSSAPLLGFNCHHRRKECSPEFKQLVSGEDSVTERVTMTTSLYKVSIWVLSKQRTWLCIKLVTVHHGSVHSMQATLAPFAPGRFFLMEVSSQDWVSWTQTRNLMSSMKQNLSFLNNSKLSPDWIWFFVYFLFLLGNRL